MVDGFLFGPQRGSFAADIAPALVAGALGLGPLDGLLALAVPSGLVGVVADDEPDVPGFVDPDFLAPAGCRGPAGSGPAGTGPGRLGVPVAHPHPGDEVAVPAQ